MGNNLTGATSTKIFFLEVGGPGWDKLRLVTDPRHVLYEADRLAIPVDEHMVQQVSDPEIGIINALVVRKLPDGTLEIISGRQRYKWAIEAKKLYPDRKIKVPLRIMSLKDYTALKASVVENAHRKEETIVSKGEKANRMLESGYDRDDICLLWGVEWTTVDRWIKVSLASQSVRDAVANGTISETMAVNISRKPYEKQHELVKKTVERGRDKPGRKKGDNRRRIKITATELDSGGYELQISKCSDVELSTVLESIESELERRRSS